MFSEAEVELLMNCYYTPFIIYGIAADAPKRKKERKRERKQDRRVHNQSCVED
jgi:hypothetical protein